MSSSPDIVPDDPDTEVEEAIKEAARLTSDPVFRQWCESYLDGTDDEDDDAQDAMENLRTREVAATRAVRSVWPRGVSQLDAEGLLRHLETGVPNADAAQWAIAAAALSALEFVRSYSIPHDLQSPECQRAGAIARHALRLARSIPRGS